MQLSFAEKLQILRKRIGLNQGAFGAKAFDLPQDSGRTKIKNIELGKQLPTDREVGQIAQALGVPETLLTDKGGEATVERAGDACVSHNVLDRFPNLGPYLEMLNKAVALGDEVLIEHIGEALAVILQPSRTGTMRRVQ